MQINITVTDAKSGRVLSSTTAEVEVPVVSHTHVEREVATRRPASMEDYVKFAERASSTQRDVDNIIAEHEKAQDEAPSLPRLDKFSDRVKWFMAEYRYNAPQMAVLTGVARSTILNWRAGGADTYGPNHRTRRALAKATGIPYSWWRYGRTNGK